MTAVIFHLAFPVTDLETARHFYVDRLGCTAGRASAQALILNFYNHQLVAHVTRELLPPQKGIYPRHFGLVFSRYADWEALRDRVVSYGLDFYQDPRHRFPGTPLEHYTFFVADPFANLMEFKFYTDPDAIFAHQDLNQVGDTP